MNKVRVVIYAPVDIYSGYSANSRDKVKAIIELKKEEWDVKIIPCRWGNCPAGFLDDNPEWTWLKEYIHPDPQLSYQPDIMIWITIPSEAQPVGKWNCLITAGIETTVCAPQWIEGINRMDLNIVSSKHSKDVFLKTSYQVKDNKTHQLLKDIKTEKPIEVLFEGVNLDVYKPLEKNEFEYTDLYDDINDIPESFAYLFCGHWLQGEINEDRKNVGLLVKAFYEVFKNKLNTPALILKTSGAGASYMDRREIQKKIDMIRKSVSAQRLPNVYIIHGEFSDSEINELYNHPKVKAMVNLTKGEGFGRPLLEFSVTNKPIITSNWSGHIDFLNPEFTALIPGELKPIHPSAQVKDMLVEGSQWFSPDPGYIGNYLKDVFENYEDWKTKGKRQGYYSRTNFSYEKMKEKLGEILNKNVPQFPKHIALNLPKLTSPGVKKIELPKLKIPQTNEPS
jgi:glycosyltransferase involved in cell wall biosynthesis